MRMGFIFSGAFWGVFLIAVGVVLILNMIFGIKIPVIRILFALFLIFWGVSLLTGVSFHRHGPNNAVFEEKDIAADGTHHEYSVVFGSSNVDLTGIKPVDAVKRIEVSTVFGSSVVMIDPAVPCKIHVSSAFGAARLPDGNVISFGDYTYRSESLKPDTKAFLLIDVSTVFGETRIVTK